MSTKWSKKPENRINRYEQDRDEENDAIAIDIGEFADSITGEEDEDNFDFAKAHGLKAQWHCAHCGSNQMEIFDNSMLSFDNFYYNDDGILVENIYSKPWTSSPNTAKDKPKQSNKTKSKGDLTTADNDDFVDTANTANAKSEIIAQCNKCYSTFKEKDIGKLTRFITKHGNITNVETVDMANYLVAYPPDPNGEDDDKPELKGAFKEMFGPGKTVRLTSYEESYPSSGVTKKYSGDETGLLTSGDIGHNMPVHNSTTWAKNQNKKREGEKVR